MFTFFIYIFFPFFCHLFFFLYPFYLQSLTSFYFFSFNTPALHLLVSAGRLDKQWQQREYNWGCSSPKRMGRHGTRDDYEVCESDLRHGIASQTWLPAMPYPVNKDNEKGFWTTGNKLQ